MGSTRTAFFVLTLFLCLGVLSCATSSLGNYGRIIPDAEVTEAFESYVVYPDYRYYISGVDLNPNAFMGLRRDYQLEASTLWREVAVSQARMKEIVDGMRRKAQDFMMLQYGFTITDNHGNPIGVWYSVMDARTFVRLNEDGTVRINTPFQDTYERRERGGGTSPDPLIIPDS